MKKLILIPLFLGAFLLNAASPKPNLIVIMTDDMGYADVGFNGCKDIPTPNIDRIADEGIRCTNGYVAYSVCGPSRAGFMTGRYQQRFGFERNPQYKPDDPDMGLPRSEETIANVLNKVGYTSGIVGKWHLGAHDSLHPLQRGFSFFYGHLGGGHQYFSEALDIRESHDARDEPESYRTWILRNHVPQKPEKYLTDAFSDAAVEFVEANRDNPFFLFLAYNAPHGPLQATEHYLERFPNIEDTKRRTYAAMVSAVDDGVGRVLKKLDDHGLAGDTIVVFLSDNGGPTTKNASRNDPLRGGKSDVWEGGYRVPFAIRWTGHLPAGKDYDQPVSSLDILATIAGITNAPIAQERPLDGVNLVPYLEGSDKHSPHDVLYLRKWDQQRFAVRKGDYKLVINGADSKPELYDLSKDIAETKNIIRTNPEIADELEKLRLQWNEQLMEPRFLGLIHTDSWQKKSQRQNNK